MDRKQIEHDIAIAYHMSDKDKIRDIKDQLLSSLYKLDRWFDRYLDTFDEKMRDLPPTDPIWKLYNKKFDVYQDIKMTIKSADYFLGKA